MTAVARPVAGEDLLILVDEADHEIGVLSKSEGHLGDGVLHRAFSVFLFNERGEVLIQRRATDKMLWGGFWSNSCCSHPRPGEGTGEAARRRVAEELGMHCQPRFLYKFCYHARFGGVGSERELCHVYAARAAGKVTADPAEIESWRWIAPADLDAEIAAEPARFSPWLKLEWPRIRREFPDALAGGG